MVNRGFGRLRICVLGAIAGVAVVLPPLGGCGQRSAASPTDSPPAGYFRVLVTKVVSDPTLTVNQFVIEKSGAGQVQVEGQGFGYEASLAPGPQQGSTSAHADMVIVADLIATNDAGNTLKVVMQTSSSEGGGTYSGTFPAMRAAQINGAFALTLPAGIHPLGTPLRLATLQGKPVTLTVR